MLRTPRPGTILKGYKPIDGQLVRFNTGTLLCCRENFFDYQQWRRNLTVRDIQALKNPSRINTHLHCTLKEGIMYVFEEATDPGGRLITTTPLRLIGVTNLRFASMKSCIAHRTNNTDTLKLLTAHLKQKQVRRTEWRYIETLDDLSSRFHQFTL